MPDRETPGGPGGGGPGGGPPPPRRGLLARNPFLIIVMVVAALFMATLWFKDGFTGEMKYGAFWDYLNGMPAVNQLPDAGVAENPAEREKMALRDEKPKGTVLRVEIKPGTILAEIKPRKDDIAKNRWHVDSKGIVRCRIETNESKSDRLRDLLYTRGVPFEYKNPTDWQLAMLWAMPILFFLFIFAMMFRSSRVSGENVLSFGRSRAKIVGEDKTGVTFDDVAGADEPKEELQEIVEFLKEPERFTALGGKIPKGCLLVGPPGCGKTLLARAVAGEAEVPFFSISGSDFVEMFVGVGAARVRDLFSTAKQKAPCIIFVDEIDAVGRHRGTGLGGGHDEREQTLNQLLVEMDGFDGRKSVIVLAATNRPDILDPALLRPGRFDRNVVLDPPDLRGRSAVLKIHARGKPLKDTVDLEEIARRTPGFSGADLANVMNEAALLTARRKKDKIGMSEVAEAIERVVAGPERRSRMIGEKEKRILAYHELGHALVARYSPNADRVRKISIIPRGRGALGYTLTVPEEERYIITKDELLARMRVLLGGRSAEEVVYGHQSTGAEDDLQKVTSLARSIICRWGMSDLGPVTYEAAPGSPFIGRDMQSQDQVSSETSATIDRMVRDLVVQCHAEAHKIIEDNRKLLDVLADLLLKNEVLEMKEFEEAVQEHAATPPPALPERPVELLANENPLPDDAPSAPDDAPSAPDDAPSAPDDADRA